MTKLAPELLIPGSPDLNLILAALRATDSGIVITDREGHIEWVNPAFTRLTGYTFEEVRGKTPQVLKSGSHSREFYAAMWRTVLGGESWRGELVNRRKDGSHYFEEQVITPVKDPWGKVTNLIAIKMDVSARKRTEAALVASELRFRRLADAAPLLIWTSGTDKACNFFNAGWLEFRGRTMEQELGNGWTEGVHPDDLNRCFETYAASFDQRREFLMEYRLRRHDGEYRWILDRGCPQFADDGSFTGYIGSCIDITDRKKTEDEASMQRRDFLMLIDALPGYAFMKRADGVYLQANKQFCEALGLPRDRVLGRTDYDFLPRDAAGRYAEADRSVLEAGKTILFNEEGLTPRGELLIISTRKVPLRDDAGNVTALVGLGFDISEQKRAEELLRQSQQRLTLHVEGTPLAYLEVDRELNITQWNPSATRIFGFTREEALGQPLFDLVLPAEQVPDVSRVAEDLLAVRGGYRSTNENVTKGGQRIVCEWYNTPLVGPDQQAIGIASIVQDITEQKRMESSLREAKEAAEVAVRAKSDFLSAMSHELRTPMNGVIGMAGILLDTPLNGEQQGYAETIRNSAESLLSILNEILDFSKVEAGKLVIEAIGFDLQSTLEDVTDLLGVHAHAKGLKLMMRYAPGAPRKFVGDPSRIRQVTINLVSNAIKFTTSGYVLIDVTCEQQSDSAARMCVAVHDTGIGIEAGNLGLLFTKFTQLDSSTTRKYGGTGLGLAISKQLAELMGGRIDVASQLSEGSTFRLALPLTLDPEAGSEDMAPTGLEGLRILVLDGHPVSRSVSAGLCAQLGMRPGPASSVAEVPSLLAAASGAGDPYRVLMADYATLSSNGGGLADRLGEVPGSGEMALIVTTAPGNQRDIERVRAAGNEAHVGRPLRASALREALSRVLLDVAPASRDPRPSRQTGAGPGAQYDRERLLAGRRVLLVEDNAVNQKVGRALLSKLGCRVEVASNGLEAVQMAAHSRFDAVLMDCQMPEMDGFEATTEIRRLGREAGRMPIIALTCAAMDADRSRCIEAGMNDYLSKPVSAQKLEQILEKWILPPEALQAGWNGDARLLEPAAVLEVDSK